MHVKWKKWIASVAPAICVVLVGSAVAVGQTVSSVAPVVTPGTTITSSSPLPNGGTITTVYRPPQFQGSRTTGTPTSQTVVNRIPVRTASAQTTSSQPQTQQTTVNQGVPAIQNFSGAQPIGTGVNNQNRVISTTTYSPQDATANGYYQNVPAASTQPTLSWQPQVGTGAVTGTPIVSQQVVGQTVVPISGNLCTQTVRYAPIATRESPVVVGGTRPVKAYRPIIPLRREVPAETYVAQGLLGQPKAYVQGQGVRNFFRYILP